MKSEGFRLKLTSTPHPQDLRLIAHCMDDRELRELNSFSYITKEELAQIREGKIELLVSVLMQNFFTIYPIPALFSPLSGCMSGSLSLEKVKALLTVSPEWVNTFFRDGFRGSVP